MALKLNDEEDHVISRAPLSGPPRLRNLAQGHSGKREDYPVNPAYQS